MFIRKWVTICLSLVVMTGLIAPMALAEITNLNPPEERGFVVDSANILTAESVAEIQAIADQLLTDTAIPIIVVTIQSMSSHGGSNMTIETFSTQLFNEWQIGHPVVNGQSWNRGILLVVSSGDRKARIELGADWAHDFDPICQRIMDEQIIPNFKEGNYPQGIIAGVVGLEHMARGLELPPPVKPKWFFPVVTISIILFIFTVVSLIRRGSSGWAWLFWGVVFSILFFVILSALRSSNSGGFGGGSFGGGFSGGGGASGSW
jgi:uncharacterized protein